MNFSLPFLGDKQLLSFLGLRISKNSTRVFDECKTHLRFESISHAIFEYFISKLI